MHAHSVKRLVATLADCSNSLLSHVRQQSIACSRPETTQRLTACTAERATDCLTAVVSRDVANTEPRHTPPGCPSSSSPPSDAQTNDGQHHASASCLASSALPQPRVPGASRSLLPLPRQHSLELRPGFPFSALLPSNRVALMSTLRAQLLSESPRVPLANKRCTSCLENVPLDRFDRIAGQPGRYRNRCRACSFPPAGAGAGVGGASQSRDSARVPGSPRLRMARGAFQTPVLVGPSCLEQELLDLLQGQVKGSVEYFQAALFALQAREARTGEFALPSRFKEGNRFEEGLLQTAEASATDALDPLCEPQTKPSGPAQSCAAADDAFSGGDSAQPVSKSCEEGRPAKRHRRSRTVTKSSAITSAQLSQPFEEPPEPCPAPPEATATSSNPTEPASSSPSPPPAKAALLTATKQQTATAPADALQTATKQHSADATAVGETLQVGMTPALRQRLALREVRCCNCRRMRLASQFPQPLQMPPDGPGWCGSCVSMFSALRLNTATKVERMKMKEAKEERKELREERAVEAKLEKARKAADKQARNDAARWKRETAAAEKAARAELRAEERALRAAAKEEAALQKAIEKEERAAAAAVARAEKQARKAAEKEQRAAERAAAKERATGPAEEHVAGEGKLKGKRKRPIQEAVLEDDSIFDTDDESVGDADFAVAYGA